MTKLNIKMYGQSLYVYTLNKLLLLLLLTICLCDENSLHNSILYIINNIMDLKQMHLSATSKEIGKLALLFHCLLIT